MAAALGLSACSHSEPGAASAAPAPAPPAADAVSAAPAPTASIPPVPPPEALTDVLYRLADPGVPGAQKLNLIEGATPENAPVLDQFATALLNGGYAPTTFTARDLAWSDRHPADVVATVDVGGPGVGGFTFPMEFKPHRDGWQLAQQTADLLLAFPPAPAPAP